MANVFIDDTNLNNIANAIRGRNSSNNTYLPAEMGDAILNIDTGLKVHVKNLSSDMFTNEAGVVSDSYLWGKTIFIDGICAITILLVSFQTGPQIGWGSEAVCFYFLSYGSNAIEDEELYDALYVSRGMSALSYCNSNTEANIILKKEYNTSNFKITLAGNNITNSNVQGQIILFRTY